MDKLEFEKRLSENISLLESEYLDKIPNDINIKDYGKYNLDFNFKVSNVVKDCIKDKVIKNSTDWNIGDKFVKKTWNFYKDHFEIISSKVWKIGEISIMWNSDKGYYLYFSCSECDVKFPERKSFSSLEDLDIVNKNGVRIKYKFERI